VKLLFQLPELLLCNNLQVLLLLLLCLQLCLHVLLLYLKLVLLLFQKPHKAPWWLCPQHLHLPLCLLKALCQHQPLCLLPHLHLLLCLPLLLLLCPHLLLLLCLPLLLILCRHLHQWVVLHNHQLLWAVNHLQANHPKCQQVWPQLSVWLILLNMLNT